MPEVCNVWVIDDDRSIRWVLEKALQRADMAVTGFSDASGVIEALSHERPDVVVSDIRMPGKNGIELLKRAKATSPGRLIFFSAVTDLLLQCPKPSGSLIPNSKRSDLIRCLVRRNTNSFATATMAARLIHSACAPAAK